MTTQVESKCLLEQPKPNSVIVGDCIDVMATFPAGSIDFVLTDPPYVARYRSREGQTIRNDDSCRWIEPAFSELFRVLRNDSLCVSFYGWPKADIFLRAFKRAGFYPVSHLTFVKRYTSKVGFTEARHELAYVLAKGNPAKPETPISDVQGWQYTGNRHHPTQKPISTLVPLLSAFSKRGDVVLDPFCGSGSTLVAARATSRRFIGIELDPVHAETARKRLSPRS